jgi:glycosyltransferase involved in cell wall biosynthesis
MKVSVIVVTRNHSSYLAGALQALSLQNYSDFEIIVVDSSNGVEQSKSADLAARHGAKYVFEQRRGVAIARNAGLPFCTGDIIAYTDDDCLPKENWLSRIVSNYADLEVWACSGRVIPYRREDAADLFEEVAGQDLGEVRRIFTPQDVTFSFRKLVANAGKVFAKHLKSKGFAPWCVGHGSSMSFRKAALEQLGGFDNRLGGGAVLHAGEDIDIHYRILKSGHSITYDPTAVVRHNHHRTNMEDVYYTRYFYTFAGTAIMAQYWKDPLMFFSLCGRFIQLLIKFTQYNLTGRKELARVFKEDLRGMRDGIAAQKKNPRDPKLKPAL